MARTEYASLAELKAWLTMAASVVDRDGLLTSALDAAHEAVEELCGRRFDLTAAVSARTFRTAERVTTDASGQTLTVDDIGSLAGLVVETGISTFTAVSSTIDYTPENAIARGRAITGLTLSASGWPGDPQTRVRVTAKWGWPAVPGQVKQATLTQAARLYSRRNSPEGVLGSAEWGAVRVTRVDPDVEALLAHYVIPGFG
jgi:hypothetical protein